ncbi:MAG: HAMP domain-containing sensor histidine kinase [Anaerolineales bacterium]|nr:HAMP domain-containing sensor histidine kinase [Anaerolineales bacterium]
MSEQQDRLYKHWPALVLIVAALYIIWLNTAPSALGSGLLPATLVFGVRALVAWVSLRALAAIKDAPRSHAWRILVVGLLIWLFADALAVLEWSLAGTLNSAPSVRDLLRVAGFLAIGYALATYPTSHPERFGRIREVLEVIILILAVFALAWLIFFRPTTRAGFLNIPQIFWLSVYPVLDVILLVFAVRQMLLRVRIRGGMPFVSISFAMLVLFVSDLGASFEGLDPPPSASLVQVGWIGSMTLFGLAIQRAARERAGGDLALDHEPIVRLASRLEPLIPVALTYAVVGYLLFDWWFSGNLDWVGVGMSAALIVLLFSRQAVIAGQQEMRQFAALVHATGDLAFIAGQDGSLHMANPALRRVLGERGEPGLPDLSAFVELPESVQVDLETLVEAAARQGWSGEVNLISEAQGVFPALLSLDPVVSARSGEIMIAGTAHDLSLIRKREDDLRVALDEISAARSGLAELNAELEDKVDERTKELKQTVADLGRLNEELKTLEKLKSEFVVLVSHELRSPLTNIRSGIELVLEAHPGLPEGTRESLSLVESETRRLSQFVEMILDISALEAGKFHIETQDFQIQDAYDNACARLTQQLAGRKITTRIEPDLPVVKSDRAAVESVFYHLLDNSSKYAPEGEISVQMWTEGPRLYVSVADEGPGISPDQRDKVFDMFHRLDGSDAREVYGHGLGLPMVKRLLEAIGGDISISAHSDRGVTVTFWIPAEEA